ncbi:FAD-dependent oxidoreductase [Acidovorax sp. GBBC 3334]|uniref:FAD-dependent oxidoreductase n=1 Tax=Acidovorax sp. GBBC 3334 TaxID=2940496 RepID=UPI002303BF1A|nr:FAD-dependent oxidoreductase [Acidovorax sp. GBBC 3334]MDA8455034.1 FAD-dependent oxidoreductase [Acidovorax sp. GBBC 3334]
MTLHAVPPSSPALRRRHWLQAAGASAAAALLPGCGRPPPPPEGGFTGIDMERGHALRDRLQKGGAIEPDIVRRTQVVIAGGGVAGLAAARSLRLAGVDDFVLLEMEDTAGGNSRAGQVNGIACPLGAHYLPVPGDGAREVQDLLEELGLRRRVAGRWQIDERHLCHSPQERLFFQGAWQDGLLPMNGVGESTIAQYRRFSLRVAELGRAARFAMPTFKLWKPDQPLSPALRALDAATFDAWLAQEGFDDAHLRWYLDYSCRDDYGAGTARVSAWAGIHYFASRHGFHAPGEAAGDERDGVLTWPEGNGWLTQRLAAPLHDAGQLRAGSTVLRIEETRSGVEVDVLHHASDSIERWQARRCVVALPVFVAARVVRNPPAFLAQAAQRLQWAPWLVANLHIDAPLADREGAAPAWDNVLYADPAPGGLGYVDAGHQRLDPRPGPTVLSYYRALGDVQDGRRQLAEQPWTHWRDAILASLSVPHPDLRARVTRVEITRYGHAMAIPVPGTQAFLSQIGRMPPQRQRYVLSNGERIAAPATPGTARLAFAHADWSGYSVFEEAFTRGHAAGMVASA